MTDPDPGYRDSIRKRAADKGYEVVHETRTIEVTGWFVKYEGADAAHRALRDTGPFDNENDAWARAVSHSVLRD